MLPADDAEASPLFCCIALGKSSVGEESANARF